MRSLNRISRLDGTIDHPTANTNLLQRSVERRSGSRPRNQKRRPSRLIIGNTNRVVNVERSSPTTETFRKLTRLTQAPYWLS